MTLLTQAIAFAAGAHDGATRKGSRIPYMVHPMETAAIAATMTEDEEVLAAAVLHDVMEDCGVSLEQLCVRFGLRVAEMVAYESQIQEGDPCLSWEMRKREAVRRISRGSRETQIIALADKLSNMRAIDRDFAREGAAMFFRFHQQDMGRYAWYYRSCVRRLERELGTTEAWRELRGRVERVFGWEETGEWIGEEDACAV